MWEFFHGWQRKAGCGILLIALALMGLWIRSFLVYDIVVVAGSLILSNSGCLACDWRGWRARDPNPFTWQSENASPFDQDWYFDTDGIRLPFWSFVIPLTLLSAFLILRRPKKGTEKAMNDER